MNRKRPYGGRASRAGVRGAEGRARLKVPVPRDTPYRFGEANGLHLLETRDEGIDVACELIEWGAKVLSIKGAEVNDRLSSGEITSTVLKSARWLSATK